MIEIKFLIVSCGYQCENTIQKCIDSVDMQSYENMEHWIAIDGGIRMGQRIIEWPNKKRRMYWPNKKYGKMKNFYDIMDNYADIYLVNNNLVVIDLDADDYLEPNAMKNLSEIYENENIWATHGSYKCLSGKPGRFAASYTNDNFRGTSWKGSHLKSFRAPLFYNIKPRDLKDRSGNWVQICADMAFFLPILEMAGLDRVKFVPDILYNYNDLSPLNDHKVAGEEQKRIEHIIRKRKPYRRLVSL